MKNIEEVITKSSNEFPGRVADIIEREANKVLASKKRFSIGLSGGKTPKKIYTELSKRETIDWNRADVFWVDERCVPPTSEESNYALANKYLFSQIPYIPSIYRIKGENPDPANEAKDYEKIIRKILCSDGNCFPSIDILLLGIGVDGHVASLFPNTSVIDDENNLVSAVWVNEINKPRITMTFPMLNSAKVCIFMINGKEKVSIYNNLYSSDGFKTEYPVSRIMPKNGRIIWVLDDVS